MSQRITVNIGFITNSSSCVYYFPKRVLEDPEVQAFIEAHDLENGYVGSSLWNRGGCSSFLVTKAQKQEAKRELWSYDGPAAEEPTGSISSTIDPDDDGAYVIYGDEYRDTTHLLCEILSKAYARIDNSDAFRAGYVDSFN